MDVRGASHYQGELDSSELANKALAIEAERISHETAQQQNQTNHKTGQANAQMHSVHGAQQAMLTESLLIEATLGNNQSDMHTQQNNYKKPELQTIKQHCRFQHCKACT